MSTPSKEFNINVNEGLSLLQKVQKSTTYKNIMHFSQRALDHFNKAIEIAIQNKIKDKLDYLYQYLCVIKTYMGDAEKNEKHILEAIKYYSEALKENDKTKKNYPHFKRKAMINHTLMQLSAITEQFEYALSFANQVIDSASKVEDQPQFMFEYMLLTEQIIQKIGTNMDKEYLYESIFKLHKIKEIDDQLRGKIYWVYGNYLIREKLNVSKSIKILTRAKKSFEKINETKTIEMIEMRIKEIEQINEEAKKKA